MVLWLLWLSLVVSGIAVVFVVAGRVRVRVRVRVVVVSGFAWLSVVITGFAWIMHAY